MNMVISNGVLVTINSTKAVHEKGMVVINNDTISYAGGENNTLIPPNSKVIDAKGGIIMPGLINTHTHIGMSLFRTLADDTADRLKKYLFPLEKKICNTGTGLLGIPLHSNRNDRGGNNNIRRYVLF